MKDLKLQDLASLVVELETLCQKLGLEAHPFKIGWYNESVGEKFSLPYSDDTLAFVVISRPCMFEKAFLPFLATNLKKQIIEQDPETDEECETIYSSKGKRDPLDECMISSFSQITSQLVNNFGPVEALHDFELAPNRRPKILVQTAGHVSGAVRFYRPEDCPSLCNRGKKVYPVCLHPRYGGWFALRGVLIMTQLTSTQLQKKEPPVILRSENEIAELLELYNDHWRDWRFRDVIEVDERYSSDQIQYFDFPPGEQRWHLIKRILKEHETDVLEG